MAHDVSARAKHPALHAGAPVRTHGDQVIRVFRASEIISSRQNFLSHADTFATPSFEFGDLLVEILLVRRARRNQLVVVDCVALVPGIGVGGNMISRNSSISKSSFFAHRRPSVARYRQALTRQGTMIDLSVASPSDVASSVARTNARIRRAAQDFLGTLPPEAIQPRAAVGRHGDQQPGVRRAFSMIRSSARPFQRCI